MTVLLEPAPQYLCDWHITAHEGDLEYEVDERTGLQVIANPLVFELRKRNLVVTTGKQLALDRLFGLGGAVALAGTAVGTGSTAPAAGDSALTGAVYKAFTTAPSRSGLVVTCATQFTSAEANININEAGLQTASGGVLFNRISPIGLNKTTNFTATFTTTITQA